MFATHYHEMAALSSKCPQAFNMHTSVFVNEEKVTHLYKVEPGSCSKSYGIEIAKLAGFDENILERANELNKVHNSTTYKFLQSIIIVTPLLP